MIFHETAVAGAFVIEPERLVDERGFFARTWCQRELQERGLDAGLAQCSISFNLTRGTLRGMHYQIAPYAETKLVRCTAGAIFDVIVDLRPGSKSFRRWCGVELSQQNRKMLYIPKGCAHGFLTLSDDVEVFYQISEFYSAAHARGVRWNDPAFAIQWPGEVKVISERDRSYPDSAP